MNGQERLYQRKWGVFNHYLYGAPSQTDKSTAADPDWNRRVETVDVERIARTLHETGAGYYFITVMQGRKYMLAPNETYDRIAGTKPGEACARRDLILELALALKRYDIDLYLYYTGDGPHIDEEIGAKFGFVAPRTNVSMEFVQNWSAVLKEYAVRYGDLVKGWWIDGCYEWFGYDDARMQLYQDAAKAGHPAAVVAFNNGVKPELQKWFRDEEFVCGEFNDFVVIPKSRFIDGAQAHVLAPLGVSPDGSEWNGWCKPGCKRDAAYMCDYVKRVNAAGGVVTIDIVIYADGSFDPEQIELLKQLGKEIPCR